MALDRRLRDALERSADSIDPAVEASLEQVIRRGTRLQQNRAGTLLAAAVAVVLLAVGIRYSFPTAQPGGPDPSASPSSTPRASLGQIAGTYTVNLTQADPSVADLGVAGDWTLILRPSGGMDLTPPASFAGSDAEGHTFTLDGSALRTDLYYNDYCDAIGVYEWSLTPTGLALVVVEDACSIRRVVLATKQWTSTE